jgi:ankyrin repeat protein
MNPYPSFGRLCHSKIFRLATVTLIALAWGSPAFSSEIHNAAQHGDVQKIKALLNDNPALVFSKDNYGNTPLHDAALNGHKDVAELLVAHGADVNAKNNNGSTPLHLAASYKGHKDVAELLLANKAKVNAEDNKGQTPLHLAAAYGHKEVAQLLSQHGGHE